MRQKPLFLTPMKEDMLKMRNRVRAPNSGAGGILQREASQTLVLRKSKPT